MSEIEVRTMPRPSRCRRICDEPAYDSFAPCGTVAGAPISLTLDEYESIRLIDLEKRTHAQCAEQMGVSRTTVTEIYERARHKLADCLVNGRPLQITGGHYRLCDGTARCGGVPCRKSAAARTPTAPIRTKGANSMRIAVTYENGNVFQHFGHTASFKLYDVENSAVTAAQVISTNGSGHGALAGLLAAQQVDALICGGIGGGAQMALSNAGIRLYAGVSGSADEAVQALLNGTLHADAQANCSHHDHGHTCAQHSCGADKHGCSGN